MTTLEKQIETFAIYRLMIIDVLNDEHGVNQTAFERISAICIANNWTDILNLVDDDENGRYWLGEDDAEDLKG